MSGIRFADVKSFVAAGLSAMGYTSLPDFEPGPASNTNMQKIAPGAMIFLTVGGGAGLTTEQLFDRPFITTLVISDQGDYDGGEKLAEDLDTLLLRVNRNARVGNAKVLYINRTGGAPLLIEKDAGDRYHFPCSYIVETQTGL